MVTIIIPIHDGESYIARCFDSLFRQTYSNFEIFVIDNASTDRTQALIRQYPVVIHSSPVNLGWALANNVALRRTITKYAFLLNIDTIVEPRCIERLVQTAERHPNAALVSPAILEYQDFPRAQSGHPLFFDMANGLIRGTQRTTDLVEVSFVPGTAAFVNLDLLGPQAYFREDFFMYHEDVELSLRILADTTFSLLFCPNAYVWHDSKQSFVHSSTCRRALDNLFVCLHEFQSRRAFLQHYPNYAIMLASNYKMYKQYFPVVYPLWSIVNLGRCWLRLLRRRGSRRCVTPRIESTNRQLTTRGEAFRFVF